jgi:hypothetical protein
MPDLRPQPSALARHPPAPPRLPGTPNWCATSAGEDGRRRIAVNLRLADDPDQIASLLIDHFDGLDSFKDLPREGKRVKDMWF